MDASAIDYTLTPASPRRTPLGYRLREPEPPLVSIITPFYDTGPVFWETYVSVFGQTLQAWEWIIVDDGSTHPDALAILSALEGRDPRIRIVRHDRNRGLSASRNTGVAAATCEYVVLLDSDDLIEPVALESWLWFLHHHPGFAFVNGAEVGFGAQEFLIVKGFREREGFLEENRLNPTCMIRRSVFHAVGGMDEDRRGGFEDWDFWLKCASQGFWGDTLEELHIWYRRRENHADRWVDYDGGARQAIVAAEFRARYGPLIEARGFPREDWLVDPEAPLFESALVGRNRLANPGRRAVVATDGFADGDEAPFVLTIVRALQSAGFEVTILVTDSLNNARIGLARSLTEDCIVLPSFLSPSLRPLFVDYCIQSRDAELLVITGSPAACAWAPHLRTRNPRLASVDYLQTKNDEWRHGGLPRYAALFDSAIDSHGVASVYLQNWLVRQGVASEKIQVIYTGGDSDLFEPDQIDPIRARSRIGLKEDSVVIACIGPLSGRGHAGRLCAILGELAAAPELRFEVVIAGDGPDRHLVERVVDQDASRRIKWLATPTREDIRDLLGVSHVLLLPSTVERIPPVLYDAMLMGVAVVAMTGAGVEELVRPACGFLIEKSARETADFTEVLVRLIAEPSLARQLGAEGRRRARAEFTLECAQSRLSQWLTSSRRAPDVESAVSMEKASRMALFLQTVATSEAEALALVEKRLGSVEQDAHKLSSKVSKLQTRVEKLTAERDKLKARERELKATKKPGGTVKKRLQSIVDRVFRGAKRG